MRWRYSKNVAKYISAYKHGKQAGNVRVPCASFFLGCMQLIVPAQDKLNLLRKEGGALPLPPSLLPAFLLWNPAEN